MNKTRKSLGFETALVSRDELALFLLNTANKVKLVNRKIKDFSSHSHFSVIYNKEELSEILNITIAKVINAHEAYILKQLGQPIPENYPKISDELDLSTFGNIIGYLRSAYDNNISKDYKKHIANKRSANVISYDSAQQDESSETKQGNAVFNLIFENSIDVIDNNTEYHRLLKDIFKFLKAYDKKINTLNKRKNIELRDEKKSKLAYLFLYTIDPKYKGKFIFINEKLPTWTQYLYKKNKEEMAQIIKKNFSEHLDFLYTYLNEFINNPEEFAAPKQKENHYDQSCDVSTCFNYIFKENKVQVELIIQLFRINNGKREILESEIQKKIVNKNEIDFAKSELNISMNSILLKFKNSAEQRRNQISKDIYSKVA